METILKSEIFFFIASVSVCILTVVFLIALVYLIKILKDIEKMTKKLKKTISNAEESLSEIGERVTDSPLFNFVFGKKKNKK
jgi:uncharacterized protein YoxC